MTVSGSASCGDRDSGRGRGRDRGCITVVAVVVPVVVPVVMLVAAAAKSSAIGSTRYIHVSTLQRSEPATISLPRKQKMHLVAFPYCGASKNQRSLH